MHRKSDMLRVLARLNLHFPRTGRTAAELEQIAGDWAADLARYPLTVVERAAVCARRECEYFPSTAMMVTLCARSLGELERYQARRMALPESSTAVEANRQRGMLYCRQILARLDRAQGASCASLKK